MIQDNLGPPGFLLAHSQLTRSSAGVSHLSSFNCAINCLDGVQRRHNDITTDDGYYCIKVNHSQMAFFQVVTNHDGTDVTLYDCKGSLIPWVSALGSALTQAVPQCQWPQIGPGGRSMRIGI